MLKSHANHLDFEIFYLAQWAMGRSERGSQTSSLKENLQNVTFDFFFFVLNCALLAGLALELSCPGV